MARCLRNLAGTRKFNLPAGGYEECG